MSCLVQTGRLVYAHKRSAKAQSLSNAEQASKQERACVHVESELISVGLPTAVHCKAAVAVR